MAANLSGMFTQLNNAINANPMGRQFDNTAVGMTERPQDRMNPFIQGMGQGITGLMGGDKSQMATSQQAKLAAEQQMAQLDLNTEEGLQKAAQLYQGIGMMPQAMQMMERAQAKRAQGAALLEEGQKEIQSEVTRKKDMQDRSRTSAIAIRNGDPELAESIRSGDLSGEAYMKHQMEKKKLYELSQGEMLTDDKGNIIRLNPKLEATGGGSGGKSPAEIATNIKIWDAANLEAEEATVTSGRMDGLADQIDAQGGLGAGWGQSGMDRLREITGTRDTPQQLRTRASQLINSSVISNLPPGPASDRDIAILQKGFPNPDTASASELSEFFRAQAAMERRVAQYQKMRGQHTIEGRHAELQSNWESFMDKENYKAAIERLPTETVATVLKLQDNPEAMDEFRRKTGIDPQILIRGAQTNASQ